MIKKRSVVFHVSIYIFNPSEESGKKINFYEN